jgi:alpha-glucosidase
MRQILLIITLSIVAFQLHAKPQWQIDSPNNHLTVMLTLSDDGLTYQVKYKNHSVIKPSKLGFEFKGQPPLQSNLRADEVVRRSINKKWSPIWGQRSEIEEHFNEVSISLSESSDLARKMTVTFRVFDDGVGFRYTLGRQSNLTDFVITKELTEFAFAKSFDTWWIPAYRNQRYEYQYLNSALSSVDVAHTPITLLDENFAISVHEAALENYASMVLKNVTDNHITFNADLVPWANGDKVYAKTPLITPWRTIQIADNEVDLLNSDLILNLNEPAKAEIETDYIKPGKYMGIWWEMHIGEKDWSPGEIQGATTKRALEYIDFASKHDIDGVLVEGWNTGWEGQWWQRPPTFNFTQPAAGFDIDRVSQYAQKKGIRLIGHHETAAGIKNYEDQMEDAFTYYEKLGVQSVKMGYVGTRLENAGKKEWHHGQFMVEHFSKVVNSAAKHQVMINGHETIKDTGLSRTYPNLMTREAVRGMEYNGGSPDGGNLPNHTVIIPFTRGLSGPIDFTPGIFNFDYQKKRPNNRIPTTLAKQLALYVTLYSPLQMAADLPENYQDHPAFTFIDDVPTDWQQSVALQGEIGEFLIIARQDKYSEDWYVGATSNEKARTLELPLSFLKAGELYEITSYQDAPNAHWESNPMAYEIKQQQGTNRDVLILNIQPGGGEAIRFRKVTKK